MTISSSTMLACVNELRKSPNLIVKTGVDFSRHTTFRIGGLADIWVSASSASGVSHCLEVARTMNIAVTVVGKGSNLLVADSGVRGIILSLKGPDSVGSFSDGLITVDAGMALGRLVMACAERGYEGFQHLSGIPGTIGGALAMNAGTGSEYIDRVVRDVSYISASYPFEIETKHHDDISWGYRYSSLRDEAIIISATLQADGLKDPRELMSEVAAAIKNRKAQQPLRFPNAGSVFRNPEGDFAGRLIELVGLKGKRAGDVQISPQHANFIVNCGKGLATDVVHLVRLAKERVYSEYGVRLQTEIRPIGDISF